MILSSWSDSSSLSNASSMSIELYAFMVLTFVTFVLIILCGRKPCLKVFNYTHYSAYCQSEHVNPVSNLQQHQQSRVKFVILEKYFALLTDKVQTKSRGTIS